MRDVEPHQRADVGGDEAVGADDLDHRPAAPSRLAETWPTRGSRARAAASIVSSSSTFSAKGTRVERTRRRYRGGGWCVRGGAAGVPFAGSSSCSVSPRAADRGRGNLVGMGKAGHLARDAAQAEARHRANSRRSSAGRRRSRRPRRAILQVELAIVVPRRCLARALPLRRGRARDRGGRAGRRSRSLRLVCRAALEDEAAVAIAAIDKACARRSHNRRADGRARGDLAGAVAVRRGGAWYE